MDALTFGYFPKTEEAAKDRNTGLPVFGAAVAKAEFVRAVLSHGTYERYFFLCDSEYSLQKAQHNLRLYPGRERVEFVLVDDSHKLRQIDRMNLFLPDSSITDMVDMRRFFGRARWPITGVTHSLSFTSGMSSALTSLFEELYSFDCLVCTSQAGRKTVEGIINSIQAFLTERIGVKVEWPVQLPVIPLGVDAHVYAARDKLAARRRLGIADHRTVFLYFGRFSVDFKMDPWPLLLSFSQGLAREKPDALLVMAGDDTFIPLAPQLKHSVKQLGISDQVLIMPNVANMEKLLLYWASDVFISLVDNVQETFGISIVEAMAAGLPVIASDWNGYKESVVHGETGFLIPTGYANCVDYVSHLANLKDARLTHWMLSQAVNVDMTETANYMRVLYDNPDLRRRMGEQGRRRVLENYDWPGIVRTYETLWADMLQQAAAFPIPEDKLPRHGLTSYNYLSVFEHYATAMITDDVSVRITPLGQKFINGQLPILPLTIDLAPFKSKLLHEIASHCIDAIHQPVGALIERIRKDHQMTKEIVFHHIIRLVKYGILGIVSSNDQIYS